MLVSRTKNKEDYEEDEDYEEEMDEDEDIDDDTDEEDDDDEDYDDDEEDDEDDWLPSLNLTSSFFLFLCRVGNFLNEKLY